MPCPQLSRAPSKLNSRCNSSTRLWCGLTSAVTGSPLRIKWITRVVFIIHLLWNETLARTKIVLIVCQASPKPLCIAPTFFQVRSRRPLGHLFDPADARPNTPNLFSGFHRACAHLANRAASALFHLAQPLLG